MAPAPVRILVTTRETLGMTAGIVSLFFGQTTSLLMRWPVLALGDLRIRVGGNLASDQPNIGS